MTTSALAHTLIKHCKDLQFSEARKKLFSRKIISIEADGSVLKGLRALNAKQKQWHGSIEKIHGVKLSKPLINGDFFSIAFTWDVTYKGQPRGRWKEIGIYRVKKSKIISEQYFY
jgi:hypothetical protein